MNNHKYLKYKIKYLTLKKLKGGILTDCDNNNCTKYYVSKYDIQKTINSLNMTYNEKFYNDNNKTYSVPIYYKDIIKNFITDRTKDIYSEYNKNMIEEKEIDVGSNPKKKDTVVELIFKEDKEMNEMLNNWKAFFPLIKQENIKKLMKKQKKNKT